MPCDSPFGHLYYETYELHHNLRQTVREIEFINARQLQMRFLRQQAVINANETRAIHVINTIAVTNHILASKSREVPCVRQAAQKSYGEKTTRAMRWPAKGVVGACRVERPGGPRATVSLSSYPDTASLLLQNNVIHHFISILILN